MLKPPWLGISLMMPQIRSLVLPRLYVYECRCFSWLIVSPLAAPRGPGRETASRKKNLADG
eukprot:1505737-Pyramimonas_sp.AAC.1